MSNNIGAPDNAPATDTSGSWSVISILKGILSSSLSGVSYSTASVTPRSGTIATGGVAQSFMSANAARKGWFIQNVSTGDLWVNCFGGTASAAQPSILIKAGQLYETPPGGSGGNALSIFGATTGQAFTAGEW